MRVSYLICLVSLVAGTIALASNHSSSNPLRSSQASSGDSKQPENCLTVAEVQKQIGKSNCVTGTVVRVEEGHNGITFLDFCADYHSCPFTVVVFRGDLRSVGDVRQLQGRAITIKGKIEEYDDRAEIVLRHAQQLGDGASRLTALPKDYDVERQGHYSAGSIRASKTKKAKHTVQGAPIPIEDPEIP
jgi:DNA/RNA endonuclease YhcR with UshA esterase domain